MSKTKNIFLPVAAALALISCGGGGGGGDRDSGNTSTTTTSGKAVDGYLSGSTVFCDSNNNGVFNAGEMSVTTDNGGNFRFPSACAATIVVQGGTDTTTDYAFLGKLTAASGSTYVTPLTSLLAQTGLSKAQLATALGLPAGTDVTTLDPLASGNKEIYRRTLAVQQILQQLATVFGTLISPHQVPALYSHVAKALAAVLAASSDSLFTGDSVDPALITATVQKAVAAINADASLPDIVFTNADITAVTAALVAQVEQFLDSAANLDNVAKNLQNPLNGPIATDTSLKDYIAPAANSIEINGAPYTLAEFSTPGIAVDSLDTIGLEYVASRSDLPIDTVVDVAASLDEDSDPRILQVKVEQVRIKRDASTGTVTIAVTPDTKVHVYVRDVQGNTANASLKGSTFNPLTVVGNDVVVNYSDLVARTVGNQLNNTDFDASQFTDITGTFAVKFVVSNNLNVRKVDGTALPILNIGIFNTDYGVTGPGVQGKLTLN